MAVHTVGERTHEAVVAAYAVPSLEAAVQQAVYNALDARAKSITVWVDMTRASFTVVDDGDGIAPDDLYHYIGKCYASSRVETAECASGKRMQHTYYGRRGAFLFNLASLAMTVEIESRVKEYWAPCRKVLREGDVVFNGRSPKLRRTPGSTLSVSRLFYTLPVRYRDLSGNVKRRARVAQAIRDFCVKMSVIWPTISFEARFEGQGYRPLCIASAHSCRDRFVKLFGKSLGNALHYVSYSPEDLPFSVHGYFAFVHDRWEGLAPGIKQAKAYYQFAFLENQWIEEHQQECSSVITEIALQMLSAIPIFVLKFSSQGRQCESSRAGERENVLSKSPKLLRRLLRGFVEKIAGTETNTLEKAPEIGSSSRIGATHIKHTDPTEDLLDFEDKPATNYPVVSESDAGGGGAQQDTSANLASDRQQTGQVSCRMCFIQEDANEMTYEIGAAESDDQCFLQESSMLPEVHTTTPGWGAFRDDSERCTGAYEGSTSELEPGEHILAYCGHSKQITQDHRNNCSCPVCGHVTAMRSDVPVTSSSEGDMAPDEYTYGIGNGGDIAGAGRDTPFTAPTQFAAFDHGHTGRHAAAFTEGDLADVFFSDSKLPSVSYPQSAVCSQSVVVGSTGDHPWLTSKPNAFDCAEDLWGVCHEQVPLAEGESCDYTGSTPLEEDVAPPLAVSKPRDITSGYFSPTTSHQPIKRRGYANTTATPIEDMAAVLRVGSMQSRNSLRQVKLSKSALASLEVIRQVDRKFILVKVSDPAKGGKLLMCVDQHAADERVRLEKLEDEVFGRDGCQRNIDVHDHDPPLALLMSAQERETLSCNKDRVQSWGFDFERIPPEPEHNLLRDEAALDNGEGRVLLHTTPKVEKRAANAEDFREFVRLLFNGGGCSACSFIRPPVITRLLHSRACRSAIMFGDRLSISQCRDLVEELKACRLPFQCAHGRPSIVPLAELYSNDAPPSV